MPSHVMSKLTVRPVRTMDEVLELALARPGDNTAPADKPTPEKPSRGRERRKPSARPGTA
jgi:hypothetical protein